MDNNRVNEKGYALTELLAVIIILGILSAIAVPTMTRVIANAKDQAFVGNAIALKEAAYLFLKDEELQGKNLTKITYKELTEFNFLDNLIDPYTSENLSPSDESYVVVEDNKITANCLIGKNRNLCSKDGEESPIPIDELSVDFIKLNN